MTSDSHSESLADRLNVGIEKLEPKYIESCTNTQELEKILRVLRSGEVGTYSHLELLCESKLEKLAPKSRLLRKETQVIPTKDVAGKEEIMDELKSWTSEIKDKDSLLTKDSGAGDDNLPPVRGSANLITGSKGSTQPQQQKTKRAAPRDYKEWDKIINKLDDEDENSSDLKKTPSSHAKKSSSLANQICTDGMSPEERVVIANREKDKGNEAFRSSDLSEAITYYNRSLSVLPITAVYNNRALAYIRAGKWSDAVADCNRVLSEEPDNVKGKLRRACAYKSLRKFRLAQEDLQVVLEKEPQNRRAQDLLKEVNKELKTLDKRKAEGKANRMVIEETDGESEEEIEETITASSNAPSLSQAPPLVNGHAHSSDDVSKSTASHPSISLTNELFDQSKTVADNQSGFVTDNQSGPLTDNQPEYVADSKSETVANNYSEEAADNQSETVASSQSETVADNQSETVADNQSETVADNQSETVADNQSKTVADNQSETVADTQSETVADNRSAAATISNNGEPLAEIKTNIVSPTSNASSSASNQHTTSNQSSQAATECSASNDSEVVENGTAASEQPSAAASEQPSAVASEQLVEGPKVISVPRLPLKIELLKGKGNEMFKTGRYGEAITYYTQAMASLGNDGSMYYHRSTLLSNRSACYIKTGDCSAAVKDCTKALELTANNTKALLRRATANEMLEKYKDAYVDYRHVINLDSNASTAYTGASRCEKALASEQGSKWRAKLPKIPSYSHLPVYQIEGADDSKLVQSSAGSNRPPVIKESHTPPTEKPSAVVESNEDKFLRLKDLGNKMVAKGDFTKAHEYYTDAISLFPDRVAPYSNRALCRIKSNNPKPAIQDCDTVLKFEPSHVKALYRRAQANKMLKNYKECLSDLMNLLKIDPGNKTAKKELSVVKEAYKEHLQSLPPSSQSSTPATKQTKPKANTPAPKQSTPQSTQPAAPSKAATRVVIEEGTDSEPETAKSSIASTSSSSSKSKSRRKKKQAAKKAAKSSAHDEGAGAGTEPSACPTLSAKPTAFEFTHAWNTMKNVKDTAPYAQLLRQIPPESLASVLSNKLEAEMLEKLITCMNDHFTADELNKAEQYLKSLSSVPRFSMITMFMSDGCKTALESLFNKLQPVSSHVDKLRIAFGV